ncbi:MAG: HWE histidine kinase domain-containing protein [Pseudomonadota bacterium]
MNVVSTPRELTECDREPIQNIATVQPFGGLMKMNSDWSVAHMSGNCADLLDLPHLPRTGTNLSDVFCPAAIEAITAALVRRVANTDVERFFGLQLTKGPRLFDCAIHTVGERIVVEFEPHDVDEFVNHIALIAPLLSQLEGLSDLDTLCSKAARLVRDMLGYDRVMVYRFHADDGGEVIAEAVREDLEPYLGLRYPHTDIPRQARELFRKNRVRVIADVDAQPSPIEPPTAFGNRPLDMTLSGLRTSSEIHLRYLRNMGSAATMTLAIVRQGRLWGLISCHHMTPRLPSFSLRTVAESFSQMFSLILDRMLIDRTERLRSRARDLHSQLMVDLAEGSSLADNLEKVAEMLDGLIPHDGLSVKVGGDFRVYGASPTREEFEAVTPDLGAKPISEAFGTSRLANYSRAATAFSDRAAGALLIPISRDPYDYLILWRKPLSQRVKWAGDPSKAKVVTPGERLQPRESFAAWEETVEGHSEEWSADDLHIAEGLRVTLLEVILRMSEEVARERSRAQQQQELLIAELNHRVRNILNLIRSLVSQSQHDATSVESFATIIGGRIAALASAHDNITHENWSPAPLAKLFESEIEAYLTNKGDRFSITGEAVLIAPEAYTVLALVVHELMTNSAKYGSLCDQSGSVKVTVDRTSRGDLSVAWRERGGPPVRPPTRRGFGSTIIERSVPFELKGEAEQRFVLTGLEADFIIPKRYVTAGNGEGSGSATDAKAENPGNDNTRVPTSRKMGGGDLPERMLVVEDSMIIALDVEENLKRAGVRVIDVTSSVVGALSAISDNQPALAIVDFNLGTGSSMPVIEELTRRGVPFVLATGYAELGEKITQSGALGIIRKPYGRAEIEDLLKAFKATQSSPQARPAKALLGSGQ